MYGFILTTHPSQPLQIDRQTIDDLEIAGTTVQSLVAHLDHCWSRGGRDQLRALVLAPLSDVERIASRQRSLQHLGTALAGFGASNVGHLVDRAEHYLESRYLELPKTRVGCLSVRFWYPGMVEELVAGLEAIAELSSVAGSILFSVGTGGGDPELEELMLRINALVDSPGAAALRKGRHAFLRQLTLARIDHVMRGTHRKVLRDFLTALHRLDALHSLARASLAPGFAWPVVVESTRPFVRLEAAFHPLVRNATPYEIALGPTRVLFLTGPNMAGKTTFLKTCGLIALMAHIGMAVPAAKAELSRFDRLFSVLAVRDSIARGESLFLAEVRRVGEVVARLAAGERILLLADEMFRATNLLDAQDATGLVVTRFAACENSVFVVASHLVELADRLHDGGEMAFAHFDGAIIDGVATFTYALKPGVSHQRLGMVLLEREGVTRALADLPRAQAIAGVEHRGSAPA